MIKSLLFGFLIFSFPLFLSAKQIPNSGKGNSPISYKSNTKVSKVKNKTQNKSEKNNTLIYVYGASWCGPCQSLKKNLKYFGVNYVYIDIEKESVSKTLKNRINKGNIPFVLYPDGTSDNGQKIQSYLNK